jgi:hypothetical protein
MKMLREFSEEDIKAHEPEMKVGLLATVNPAGQPHISLISTLRANTPTQLIWGQFAEGMSKDNILQNPRAGWLVLTLDKNIWMGKADFTHTAITGREFEIFNNMQLFRYNAYFGIHKVYYMDLVHQSGKDPLPMNQVVMAAIKSVIARILSVEKSEKSVLNNWTRGLIDKLDNLKFLSYVDGDGYPVIIPLIQAQTAGKSEVIFAASAYGEEIEKIPPGATVSFFAMSFSMEDVLLRGTYTGLERRGGVLCGSMKIDWVYSPMPPVARQVYPAVEMKPVRDFN